MQEIRNENLPYQIPFVGQIEDDAGLEDGAKPYLWNRDEYYRLAELGFFEGKRVELIEGEIIEMSPMNELHATVVRMVLSVLRKHFGDDFLIDSQLPMGFSPITEPEPDVAVIKGKITDFIQEHPKTAALIIEVSDATLRNDRHKKSSLYARHAIQDYWILNLKNRTLEVYRQPIEDENTFYGFNYGEKLTLDETREVSPLVKDEAKIKIADLLP